MTNKIESLELSGYKSICDLKLDFRDINILIGANGAGKSNLLSFFKMLNYMQTESFQHFITEGGGGASFLFNGPKKTPTIKSGITFSTDKGTNEYVFNIGYARNDSLFFVDESVRYWQKGTSPQTSHPAVVSTAKKESVLPSWNSVEERLRTTCKTMYMLMRNWKMYQFHDTSDSSYMKQSHNSNDSLYLRHDGGNLAPFLLMMQSEYPDHYEDIVETIQVSAPFFYDFELRENKIDTVRLLWRQRNNETVFGPEQLSDGTLRFIALTTLLLQPNLPDLIVIDEPELGLHPFAIGILAELLKAAARKSQIIIATQSPGLVDNFSPEDVITVNRSNGASTFKRLDSDQLNVWLEEYTVGQLWEKNVVIGGPCDE